MNLLKQALLTISLVLALTVWPLLQGNAGMPNGPMASTVNSTLDQPDFNPGDGICETALGNGICTLRAAVMEANATPAADTITFIDLPGSPDLYTLTLAGMDDTALLGDLDILVDATIQGIGSTETILQAGSTMLSGIDRFFHILGDANVTLERLTIRYGNTSENGGGILNASTGRLTIDSCLITNNIASHGAGVVNQTGKVDFHNSTLLSNHAGNQGGGIFITGFGVATFSRSTISDNSAGTSGGGIFNEDGDLTIIDSTLNNNLANTMGGGLLNGWQAVITNSTISGNTANTLGGGIFNVNQVSLTNATLTLNVAGTGGGGIYVAGQANLMNTIVRDNTGGDCLIGTSATLVSGGSNLDSDGTCNLTQPGDIPLGNADLDILQNNGGPTLTHALKDSSQAIDAGSAGLSFYRPARVTPPTRWQWRRRCSL